MATVTVGNGSFYLHPSGPRAYEPGEINEWIEAVSTIVTTDLAAIDARIDELEQPSTNIIDVTKAPYNATGDGVTDDTAAIQAALTAVSYVPGVTSGGTGGTSATIYFPRGIYKITSTLTLTGNNGIGFVLVGDQALDRAGTGGSVLQWAGASGGTLFDMIAVNGTVVKDLLFNGGDLAKYVVRAREHHYATYSNQIGSSGIQFFRCAFLGPGNVTDNCCFAAGNSDVDGNTYQSSEYRFYYCSFQGNNETRTAGYGFRALNGGNTKNFVFSHCIFNYFYQGIVGLSGYLFVNECNGGIYGYETDENSCMIYSSSNTCIVLGGGMENGLDPVSTGAHTLARFLIATQFTQVYVNGVYYAGVLPPDDYVIVAGPLILDSCHFERNSRDSAYTLAWAPNTVYSKTGVFRRNGLYMYKLVTAGTSAGAGGPTGTGSAIADNTCVWDYAGLVQGDWCKIQSGAAIRTQDGVASTCHPTVILRNTVFAHQNTAPAGPPVYDGSNNWIGAGDYAKSTENSIIEEGCKYYEDGTGNFYQWGIIQGHRPKILSGCAWTDSNDAGVTVLRDAAGLLVVRIPYTAFQTAALTKTIAQWGYLPKKSKITQCVAEITQAFAHPTGTITIEIGTRPHGGVSDPDSLIVSSSTAAATLGLADGDLGIGLARATAVQGGFTPTWNTNGTYLDCTLTSSSGNLSGLTAGSVDIFLKFDPSK